MNRREFFSRISERSIAPAPTSGQSERKHNGRAQAGDGGEPAERSGQPEQSLQQVAGTFSSGVLVPFVPSADNPWDYGRAAHLLRRAVSGPTEAEIRQALREGPEQTVNRLLQPFDPPLDLISTFAWGEPNTTPPEPEGGRYDVWVAEKLGRRYRLTQWWLQTMVKSPVSIQERMTFFWHDHFATQMGKVEFAEYAFVNNQLLRAHALGNFKEMVRAVTKDPAMLTYLDGETNTRFTLNENYARELMELFTVGRVDRDGNPNYTQLDVIEAARALTGWQKQHSKTRPERYHALESIFWNHLWDSGTKTFLGKTGSWNADGIIEILFLQKADQIARFVCEKIYRLLVNMVPNDAAIDAMAHVFKENNWEIQPVLRRLLLSSHFYDVENIGALPKSLLEYHIALVRGLDVQGIPDFIPTTGASPNRDLFFRLEGLGQLPFHPPNVSGWPEGRAWVAPASLAPRIRFASDVALGRVKPVYMAWKEAMYTFDPVAFAAGFPDPEDIQLLCDNISFHFLGVPLSPEERAVVFNALLDGGREYEWDLFSPEQRAGTRIRLFLNALFALPKFQLY